MTTPTFYLMKTIMLTCFFVSFCEIPNNVLADQPNLMITAESFKDSVILKDYFVLIGKFKLGKNSFDFVVLDRKMKLQLSVTDALNSAIGSVITKRFDKKYEIKSFENRLYVLDHYKNIFEFDFSSLRITRIIPLLSEMGNGDTWFYFETTPKGLMISANSKLWTYLFSTNKWTSESGKRQSRELIKITPEFFLSTSWGVIPKCGFYIVDAEGKVLTDISNNFCEVFSFARVDKMKFIVFEKLNKGIVISSDSMYLNSSIIFDTKPLKFYDTPRTILKTWINYVKLPTDTPSLKKVDEEGEKLRILDSFGTNNGVYLKVASSPQLVHKDQYFQRSRTDSYTDPKNLKDFLIPPSEGILNSRSISFIFLPQPLPDKIPIQGGPNNYLDSLVFENHRGLRNVMTEKEGIALPDEDNGLVFFLNTKKPFNSENLRPYFKMSPDLKTLDSKFGISNLYTYEGFTQETLKAEGVNLKISYGQKELSDIQPISFKYGDEFIIDYEGPDLLIFTSSLGKQEIMLDHSFYTKGIKKMRLSAGFIFSNEKNGFVDFTFGFKVGAQEMEINKRYPFVVDNIPPDQSLCKVEMDRHPADEHFFYTIRLNKFQKMTLREKPQEKSKILVEVVPKHCFYMTGRSFYDDDPGFDASEQKGDWFKVTLRSGRVGWIETHPAEINSVTDNRLTESFDYLMDAIKPGVRHSYEGPNLLCLKPELPCVPIKCSKIGKGDHDRYQVIERAPKGDDYWLKVKVGPCKPTAKIPPCEGWVLLFGPNRIHRFSNLEEGGLCEGE